MKRSMISVMSAITIFSAFLSPAQEALADSIDAEVYSSEAVGEAEGDDFRYKITDGGAVFTPYVGQPYSGNFSIPLKVADRSGIYDVTAVGSRAFYDCTDLKSVKISENIKTIEEKAFAGCTGLNVIYSYSMEAPAAELDAFEGVPSGAVLYIKPGAKGYDAEPWSGFKQYTMGDGSSDGHFEDVGDHWAARYIYDLSRKGIIKGYEDNTFRPENLISREEAAQLLSNYIGGSGEDVEAPFDSADRWSTPAIKNLMGSGIVKGYEDGSFRPGSSITRAEFSTMVYNMMMKEGRLDSLFARPYEDLSGHWAEDTVAALAGNGIISGYDDDTFRPDNSITRAEAATILSRVSGN